ncbi:MAG: AcrR family transcriptional regulator [Dinoroseobacter sp.]|jgi:AcrR family transcriptional regulator
MSTRSRSEEEKARRREILLDAAQTVFFEKGFERTSM